MNDKYNEINVPKNIDLRIEEGINKAKLDKERIIKNRKRNISRTAIASLLALSILGGVNPALASQIPIIGNAFELIEKNIYFPSNYSEYATSINEKANSNGIDITLSEVLCDGQSLYVTYIVENEKPFKYTSWDGSDSLDMNQLVIEQAYNKVDFTKEELDSTGFTGLQGKFIDEYTFIGFQKYKFTNIEEVPDEFTFKTKINYIENYAISDEDKDYIKTGTWAFKVPVKVNKDLRNVVDLGNQDIESDFMKINSISITPFDMKIEVEYKEEFDYIIKFPFRVYDKNGEEVRMLESNGHYDKLIETFIMNSPGLESNFMRVQLVKPLNPIDKDDIVENEVINQGDEVEVIFDKVIELKYK